jgi:hypothetical protein
MLLPSGGNDLQSHQPLSVNLEVDGKETIKLTWRNIFKVST